MAAFRPSGNCCCRLCQNLELACERDRSFPCQSGFADLRCVYAHRSHHRVLDANV